MGSRSKQVVYRADGEVFTVAELYAALDDAMKDPQLRDAHVRVLTMIEWNAAGGRAHTVTLEEVRDRG